MSARFNNRVGMGPALIWAAIPSVGGILVTALAFGRFPLVIVAIEPRATAVHRFVSWGALPAGALLAGFVGQAVGLRSALICAFLLASLCFVPLLRSPLRVSTARP